MFLGTRRILVLVCAVVFVTGASENVVWGQTSQTSGGFVDSSTGAGMRPTLSAGEIQTFMPQRGAFTFPSPYSTTGVRLTNSSDCGGQDCVHSVGYSYWSNINNHTGSNTMLVFLGLERRSGGGGPTLFSYNKTTGQVQNMGPLFSADSPYSWATGEGWYFSASQPTTLYMNDGPRMLRYDVMSHAMSEVYNVQTVLGAGRVIWQMHSSNDDRVHSATVKDSTSYKELGCIAYNSGTGQSTFVAAKGDFDECQIDKSGRYLVIKENVDGRNGEDNRVIDLQTGGETIFLDENGAAGHSDLGYGYMVAEDNFNAMPGAVRIWQLGQDLAGSNTGHVAGQGTLVYELSSWATGIGHIAHGNSKNAPSSGQMACVSNANRSNLPRVNEIVCFRLDGSMQALVVAPNMSDLNAGGGGSDDYWKIPSGNIDVTGEYFIWTANMGTSRQDAFIVRIPQDKLGVSPGAPTPTTPSPTTPTPTTPAPTTPTPAPPASGTPAPAPAPTPTTPSAGSATWMSLVNVADSGGTLTKVGGCSGCPDGTAVSLQQISGTGTMQFSTSDSSTLRFVGLAASGLGTTPADVTYAIRMQSGVAEVRESGAYKTETRFAAGDTFTLTVNNGSVSYARNGSVFYTSSISATSALRGHAIFFDPNGSILNVMFGGGGAATTGGTPTASATPAAGAPATGVQYAIARPVGSTPKRRKH